MDGRKACVAFVMLIVGLFLLLEGSRVTVSGRAVEIDLGFMVVGAVLTLAYFYFIGDYLQRRLHAPPTVTFIPVLGARGGDDLPSDGPSNLIY